MVVDRGVEPSGSFEGEAVRRATRGAGTTNSFRDRQFSEFVRLSGVSKYEILGEAFRLTPS
jgi:hypothetical protein